MKVTIVPGCIGCGLCVGTCPEVFTMNDEGTAEVCSQPDENQKAATRESAEGCPVSVIEIEE